MDAVPLAFIRQVIQIAPFNNIGWQRPLPTMAWLPRPWGPVYCSVSKYTLFVSFSKYRIVCQRTNTFFDIANWNRHRCTIDTLNLNPMDDNSIVNFGPFGQDLLPLTPAVVQQLSKMLRENCRLLNTIMKTNTTPIDLQVVAELLKGVHGVYEVCIDRPAQRLAMFEHILQYTVYHLSLTDVEPRLADLMIDAVRNRTLKCFSIMDREPRLKPILKHIVRNLVLIHGAVPPHFIGSRSFRMKSLLGRWIRYNKRMGINSPFPIPFKCRLSFAYAASAIYGHCFDIDMAHFPHPPPQ